MRGIVHKTNATASTENITAFQSKLSELDAMNSSGSRFKFDGGNPTAPPSELELQTYASAIALARRE
jgi:hypothetical protein